MKTVGNYQRFLGRLLWLLIALFSTELVAAPGQISLTDHEKTFPLLQTKTGTYTNVTVTGKSKDWIFIIHSTGVCNVKASDLPPETRLALGFDLPPDKKKGRSGDGESVFKSQLAHINFKFDDIKKFASDWRTNSKEEMAQAHTFMASNPLALCIVLGIALAIHIFFSVCFWLICRKTHNAPGPLVWVPILQLIPLLRAANMPRVWFFAYFIPVLNLIAVIVWAVKIVKSRGKSPFVAFLLLMPLINFFAFLYLAFSGSAPVEIHHNEILALETA